MHSAIDLLKRAIETEKRAVISQQKIGDNLSEELDASNYLIESHIQSIEEMEAALGVLLALEESINEA